MCVGAVTHQVCQLNDPAVPDDDVVVVQDCTAAPYSAGTACGEVLPGAGVFGCLAPAGGVCADPAEDTVAFCPEPHASCDMLAGRCTTSTSGCLAANDYGCAGSHFQSFCVELSEDPADNQRFFLDCAAVQAACVPLRGCLNDPGEACDPSIASCDNGLGRTNGCPGDTGVCPIIDPNPAGDRCDNAIALGAFGTVSGNTTDFHDDAGFGAPGDACTGSSTTGPEVVYSLTLPAGSTLSAAVSSARDLGIYLVRGCPITGQASCLAGADSGYLGATEQITYMNAASATAVFLLVDGFEDSPDYFGPYDLTWSVVP